MSLFVLSRFLSYSVRITDPIFSKKTAPSPSSADTYWTHLQKKVPNIERTLNRVRSAKLDHSSLTNVLLRFAINQPLLGIRFFIWAGSRPSHGHSLYMYNKACNLFGINQNPGIIYDVMEAYRIEGCLISVKTFKVVLNLCREAKLANEGLWVLRKMKEFNCQPNTTAYNIVIRAFCEKGNVDEAAGLMREMGLTGNYPDMITYVAMVKSFVDAGRIKEACELFKVMRGHGCLPNTVFYSVLIEGVCRFGSPERALELLDEMEKGHNCKPNAVTYTSVIQSFCEGGRSMEALCILDRMEASGCSPNRVTLATLVNGLCVEECVEEAYKLIERVVGKGNVSIGESYSSLVVSLIRVGKFKEAEKVFRIMLAGAVSPDGLASSLLIKGFCLKGQVLDGFRLYNDIENMGCISSMDLDIYSFLLVGLCQDRYLVEAANLAGLMVERGIQLRSPYMENIIEHLKNSEEKELLSHFTMVQK